jgi:hypothetical protein
VGHVDTVELNQKPKSLPPRASIFFSLPASPPARRYLPAATPRPLERLTARLGSPFLGMPKSFPGVKPEFWDGMWSRLAALRPNGSISRWFLADLPTVLVVGDSVFIHGGFLEANVDYGLERINADQRGSTSPWRVRCHL